MTIYYCDVKFERLPLRFLTAFNPDGKVNTIRFVPVPAEKTTPPTTSVQDKIKETDIQVCTGNFKLPGTLTLPKKRQRSAGSHFGTRFGGQRPGRNGRCQ